VVLNLVGGLHVGDTVGAAVCGILEHDGGTLGRGVSGNCDLEGAVEEDVSLSQLLAVAFRDLILGEAIRVGVSVDWRGSRRVAREEPSC